MGIVRYAIIGTLIVGIIVASYYGWEAYDEWCKYDTICIDKGYDGTAYRIDGWNCYKELTDVDKLFPVEHIVEDTK